MDNEVLAAHARLTLAHTPRPTRPRATYCGPRALWIPLLQLLAPTEVRLTPDSDKRYVNR